MPLRREGDEDAVAFLQGGEDVRPGRDLAEVRRADLLLAFADEHDIDRQLASRGADRVERGEEGRLGTLLVHRAATHDRLPETGALDHLALERRRRPFGRVELLHVVHEIDAERALGADVDRAEHARMTVGGDDLDIGEARILRELGHIGRTLGHAAILGGDRGEGDPVADALDRGVLARLGRLADIRHRSRPARAAAAAA